MVLEVGDRGKLSGFYSAAAQEAFNIMTHGTNVSIIFSKNHGFGVRQGNSDRFDGCIGRLQRNDSDALWTFSQYPLALPNVTEGYIFAESGVTFLSLYYDKEQMDQKLTQSFESFHQEVWLCIVLSLAIVWLLLRKSGHLYSKMMQLVHSATDHSLKLVKRRRYREMKGCTLLYKVLTHFSRLDSIEVTSFSSRLIFTLLSFMSLVIIHYFSTSIKTEMVVIPFPEVYRTYDDIKRADALPLFFSGLNTESLFVDADPGTPEHSLWKYVRAKNVSLASLIARSGSWDDFYKNTDPLFERRLVMFLDSLIAHIVKRTMCQSQAKNQETIFKYIGNGQKVKMRFALRVPRSLPAYRVLVMRDPASRRALLGALFSSHMAPRVYKRTKKRVSSILQAGLFIIMYKRVFETESLVQIVGPDERSRLHFFDECMSETIVKKEPEYSPLKFAQFSTFTLYCGAALAFCCLILSLEMMIHRSLRKCRRFTRKRSVKVVLTF